MWLKGCSQKGAHELAALFATFIFNQLTEGFSLGKEDRGPQRAAQS